MSLASAVNAGEVLDATVPILTGDATNHCSVYDPEDGRCLGVIMRMGGNTRCNKRGVRGCGVKHATYIDITTWRQEYLAREQHI